MAIFELQRQQFIPRPMEEVWLFFSSPANLSVLTPQYMNFRVTTKDVPKRIYAGQIITYKVSPLFGIPLFWMTEITQVQDHRYFIDEQRRGPYRLWHHQHWFEQQGNGVLMTDIVHYELPLGILGNLANRLFLQSQLDNIFEFRQQKVAELFP